MVGTAKDWEALNATMYDAPRVPRFDEVTKPAHYNEGAVECIEAIKASMSADEFKGYLKGNTIKYLWRYRYKGKPGQDLEKAQWYLNKLKETEKEYPT